MTVKTGLFAGNIEIRQSAKVALKQFARLSLIFFDYLQIISKNRSHAMLGLIPSFLVPTTVLLNITVQK